MLTPPANAVAIEPRKAKDEPRNTGLLNRVNSRYTSVPAPAPNSAAEADIPFPMTAGTAMVAARIASSCCSAATMSFPTGGLSFTL